MDRKTAVTAADLFVLLDREFRRRKPRECTDCFVQLPYRVDARGDSMTNWEIVSPAACGRSCGDVFDELVSQFQALYVLKVDAERG